MVLILFENNLPTYWLRADVLNAAAQPCTTRIFGEIACPTGTVAFTDNGSKLDSGTYKLNSFGFTEDQTIQLTVGSHNLVANYSGDPSYKASSASTTVTVTKATPAISDVASNLYAVDPVQQFALTATVSTSSYGVAPTGTVVFLANGKPLTGTVAYTPQGGNASAGIPAALGAGLVTSISTAGTYTITSTYSGDGNYGNVTTSNSVQIVVAMPNFTLSAAPGTLSIAQGTNGTSTITVNPTGGFTGSVSLAASGLPSGVTASFNPTSATSTSTLTLTASNSATVGGPTTVTITGTSGSLAPETTTVALTVVQNFTVPGMLTAPTAANPGQATSTTMMISPLSGNTFSSNVTYTCSSGLPTGATCSFTPPSPIAAATNVTVTVQTLGPFTGTAGGAQRANEPRLRSQNQRIWLPLSLPLAGMLLLGLAGRGLPLRYKIVGLCLALALTGFLVACGGSSTPPPPPATVTVSPSTVSTLYPNLNVNGTQAPEQQQQFSATVSNSTSQTVTWAVTGGSANGTIDQTGLYKAPASLPSPASVTVTATSTAAASPGSATVNLQTPTPAVSNQTVTVTVTEGSLVHTTTFSLTVN